MHILVTGCAGFIGSHLCERLLSEGHHITGVDALTNSYDPQWKVRNLDRLCTSERFDFVHTEVLKLKQRLVDDAQLIFHLAARPGVRTSWGPEFQHYLRHNVLTTQRLLERATLSETPKRIVFASSSSVYGDTPVERVTEDHPTNPVSPYGITKPRWRTIVLGVCQVELPGGDKAAAFALFGDGRQQRDFTFVQDVVEA